MKKASSIHIGTSGWHYQHWRKVFYPDDLPAAEWLAFYQERFDSAEINNTFYRLPKPETFAAWRNTVPRTFIFAVKAGRYITHMKKLKEPRQALNVFFRGVEVLGDRLGPILFQLPPRWKCNPERLESFLKLLPGDCRYAFEFRDPSWFDGRVYDLLSEYGAAFCIYHLAGKLSPRQATADFVYVRLHGPGAAYQGSYSDRTLSDWAKTFKAWRKAGKDIYCYFDNDNKGYAVRNALRLSELLR